MDVVPKIAFYEMSLLQEISPNRRSLNGPAGKLYHGLIEKFFSNVTYVTPEDGKQAGGPIGNGSYSGMLGLLQRNETDFIFIPMSIRRVPPFVDISPVGGYVKTGILSRPDPKTSEPSFFATLHVFTIRTLIMLTFSFILLTLTFAIYRKYKRNKPAWYFHQGMEILSCFTAAPHPRLIVKSYRCLALIVVICYFVVSQMYSNTINVTMVAHDYRNIVDSVNDVVRLKHLKPIFAENSMFTSFFKNNKDPKIREVWHRPNRECIFLGVIILSKGLGQFEVFFADYFSVGFLGKVTCPKIKGGYVWFARKDIISESTSFFMRININQRLKEALKRSSHLLIQSHLMDRTHALVGKAAEGNLEVSENCTRNNIDELFEKNPAQTTMYLRRFGTAFSTISGCYLVALLALLLEHIMAMYEAFSNASTQVERLYTR